MGGRASAFNVKLGTGGIDLGVEVSSGRADSGDLEIDFGELVEDLAEALGEKHSAFGLFVDEMQDLDSALLTALLVTQHSAGQQDLPFTSLALACRACLGPLLSVVPM